VNLSKKIGTLVLLIVITSTVSASILHFNATLNPEQKVAGNIDVGFAIKTAEAYNSGVDGYGYSYGRLATTERVINALWESGIEQVLLGFGPGFATLSVFDTKESRDYYERQFDKLKIGYGITTITQIALEYGFLGVLVFTWMLVKLSQTCWSLYKLETDPYWRAFAAGSVGFSFSMLFFAYAYHATAFWGATMPALYFYAMAVVYTRYHKYQKLPKKVLSPAYQI
jgi:hypothetical protein